MKTIALFTACLMIYGCANPLNQRHTMFYTDAGGQAEVRGNWHLAEQNFERALLNANLGTGPDSNKSMALYNLGRAKGHLCKFSEAEKLLTEALQLEEKVSGPESGITTMRLFELGRLHQDRKQFESATFYFARAIPIANKLGVEQSDPIALAGVYDDFATALRNSGKSAEAEKAEREAKRLRSANAGRSAQFTPTRYSQTCSPQ